MGGRRRQENGIYILCMNTKTGESFLAETTIEASLMTGVSWQHINSLIMSGKETRDGWTFDEWEGE